MRAATVLLITVSLITSALAGPIYQFNPTSTGVTNRGVTLFWGDTLAYQNRSNFLVNVTQMPAGIPIEFTKASNGVVRALTLSESNAVNAYIISNNAALVLLFRQTAELNAKNASTNLLNALNDSNGRLLRALAEVMMDEINILRTNALLTMPARTFLQLTNGIKNKLAAQPDTE